VNYIGNDSSSGSDTASQILTKLKTVDGSGSGLDADLLDGLDSTQLAKVNGDVNQSFKVKAAVNSDEAVNKSQLDAISSSGGSDTASQILTKLKTVDGSGSGLDADLLDGHDSSYYLQSSSDTASQILTKLKTVDGTGSGLDADLLDGLDSKQFLRSDTAITTQQNFTFNKDVTSHSQIHIINGPTKKASDIVFETSDVSSTGDWGAVGYSDNVQQYNKWNTNTKNRILALEITKGANSNNTSTVVLKAPSGIFLDAPSVYVGDKNGARVLTTNDITHGSDGNYNGWLKLPDGTIMQFGIIHNTGTNGEISVTYPIVFPKGVVMGLAQMVNGNLNIDNNSASWIYVDNKTCKIVLDNGLPTAWYAVGS